MLGGWPLGVFWGGLGSLRLRLLVLPPRQPGKEDDFAGEAGTR